MGYRIAICDDEQLDIKYIKELLHIWQEETNISLQIETFNSAESFLFHYADDKLYDIIFLDIELGGMDGVTIAKKIRKENKTVQIIFISGYSDYIAEGYEVEALHYLLKPVNKEKLFSVLDRAVEEKFVAGASVLVLEKMRAYGGNSTINGGIMSVPGNAAQKKLGIKDSPELLAEDMIREGLGYNYPDKVLTMAKQAMAT